MDIASGIQHELDAIVITEEQRQDAEVVFTQAELKSTLTYERPELNIGLVFNEAYNREVFAEGLESIKEAYIGAGHLDVELTVDEEVYTQGTVQSHVITVSVEPKDEHSIGMVNVSGGLDHANQRAIQDLSGTYTPNKIEDQRST